MKKTTVKIILSILAVVVVLVALFIFVIYIPLMNYSNTHTWATVTVVAEIHADVDEVLIDTYEYLQGDTINVSNVTLLVKDITLDGEVELKVEQGNLYDDKGEPVTFFVVRLREKVNYKMDNGSVTISVDSNRYQ